MSFNFKKTFSTPFFDIEEAIDTSKPNSIPYYRMTGSDSVICCVMTMDGEFVMIRQYRPNISEYSLEFPAGGLLNSERPLEAAKREFLEETSFTTNFISLGDYKLMMNRTNIKEYIFFGVDPKKKINSTTEQGIEVQLIKRTDLANFSISGSYKQLAGLGVIQLVSIFMGLNILESPMDLIFKKFKERQDYEG